MKKVKYLCNICEENVDDLYGFDFDESGELEIAEIECTDIHICSDCFESIKEVVIK